MPGTAGGETPIVRVEEPEIVTEAGLNIALKPTGVVPVRATVPENPPTELMAIVTVPPGGP